MHLDTLADIQELLAPLDGFIRAALSRAQSASDDPTQALRGLVITADEVHNLLKQPPLSSFWPAEAEPPTLTLTLNPQSRFTALVNTFDLTPLDARLLLLCLGPEFDRRYERLYAFLQDDVSQRRPTVNLLMNLLGADAAGRFAIWERLDRHAPLRNHLLLTATPDSNAKSASLLSQPLKVDHRLVAWLLGGSNLDERLQGLAQWVEAGAIHASPEQVNLIESTLAEAPLYYMKGREGLGQRETAAAICARYGIPLLALNLARLGFQEATAHQLLRLAFREARLSGAALLLDGWEHALDDSGQPPADFWQAVVSFPHPVFICARTDWESLDTYRDRPMLRLPFDLPGYEASQTLWAQALEPYGTLIAVSERLANKFRFTPAQIRRAVHTAADQAASRGEGITEPDLYAAAQAHSMLRVGQLVNQIQPRHTWEDLILPPDRLVQLRDLRARAEHSGIVQETWGFGRKIAPHPRISALFAGESGTGKTMAAEVIAHDLGLLLYRIDLSAMVSKYIGETEKNLNLLFTAAEDTGAILFFDEADALFGKRSEVKDAHDRYANIEVAYLLQKIESYDGIAILATNLRQNLDDAFTRRLDFLIDFPFPEAEYRGRIWARHFPPEAPLAAEVDFNRLAERYALTGGNIRNVAIAAAYLAAADGRVVNMQHIQNAIQREHQKMGRLLVDRF